MRNVWVKALLAVGGAIGLLVAAAVGTTLVIPNTFVSGTTLSSSAMNANFSEISSWATQVDHSNIGASGIYASQVIPTTAAQATFGGSQQYTFPNAPAWTGACPISQGCTGATTATIGATTPVTVSGTFPNQTLACATCVTSVTSGDSNIYSTGGTTPIITIVTNPSFNMASSAASGSTYSYMPPVFTASGTAVGQTEHMVRVTGTLSASTETCGPLTGVYCGVVTLTGAAAFTSGGTAWTVAPSYTCGPLGWNYSVFTGWWGSGNLLYMEPSAPNTLYFNGGGGAGAPSSQYTYDCEGE